MEATAPIVLIMLPSFIEIVKEGLIHLISDLRQMRLNAQSLVFAVLTCPAISRIEVKFNSGD